MYDVIVVGLGGMGAAAAWHLARRGQRVLGLDRHLPVHDRGSSHGGSRLVRQAYFEDPAYVPLLLRAYELWDELGELAGAPLLHRTGMLMAGAPSSWAVAGTRRSAQQWGLPHEVLDAAAIRARYPALRPDGDQLAVFEAAAGWVSPEEATAAHLRLAGSAGAQLRFGVTVRDWRADHHRVRVSTSSGVVTAARLVLTPGAWAGQLLDDLGVPFVVTRQVQHWLAPADPELLRDHPIFLWEESDGTQFYGFPPVDPAGDVVKVGIHRAGAVVDPDTVDRTVRPDEVEEVLGRLAARLPALAGRQVRADVCLYTNTPDEHFVIGPHPRHGRVVVACGFCGHGFKFAPVVGEIVADLVVAGRTDHPIDLFDPTRFSDGGAGTDPVAHSSKLV